MNYALMITAIIVGIGTWAFRFIPLKLQIFKAEKDGPLNAFFSSTGPAAIATLFVASLLPIVGVETRENIALVLGCIAVVAAFFWKKDVAVSTILGAIVYGVVYAII